MTQPKRGDWMITFSGRQIWPLDPRPEDIDIEDIAHHLALINRYNGATVEPYSVAEHCLRASYVVEDTLALEALLHDSPEFVLGDLVSPIKHHSGIGVAYKLVETQIEDAIRRRFGLPVPQPEWIHKKIKEADYILLFTEKRDLCVPKNTHKWQNEGQYTPLPTVIKPLLWHEARRKFLLRFNELYTGG